MPISGKARKITFPARRPLFYYVTGRRQLPVPSTTALLVRIRCALSWGVDFIQLREKDLPDPELLALTQNTVELARDTGCRILVNGRLDIALAGGAHGIHLPSAGLGVTDLMPYLPKGFLVGASVHSLREARSAGDAGADYVLLSPIFHTASKAGYGKPLGLRCLARACAALRVPILGLGGIRPADVGRVLETGAAGVAGISLHQRDLDAFTRQDFDRAARQALTARGATRGGMPEGQTRITGGVRRP